MPMNRPRSGAASKVEEPGPTTSAIGGKLDVIHTLVGISFRDVAQLMNTTPETVSRWRQGRVDPQPTKFRKLATLAWLAQELSEFYSPSEAKLWLFTPQRLLGGATPADRIEQDRVEDVLAIIKQLQDGAFA
jgi:transcriptional regulator with XRE-family HTH domain